MKKQKFSLLAVFTLCLGLLVWPGCHKTLEGGGAYAPQTTNSAGVVSTAADMEFYTADSTFWLAYSSLDTVFSIERDNRDYFFKLSPSIKHTLDDIRPQALAVAQGYLKARAAYIANPTPAGLTGIQEILARMQQLVTATKAALPANSVLPTATPAK